MSQSLIRECHNGTGNEGRMKEQSKSKRHLLYQNQWARYPTSVVQQKNADNWRELLKVVLSFLSLAVSQHQNSRLASLGGAGWTMFVVGRWPISDPL